MGLKMNSSDGHLHVVIQTCRMSSLKKFCQATTYMKEIIYGLKYSSD